MKNSFPWLLSELSRRERSQRIPVDLASLNGGARFKSSANEVAGRRHAAAHTEIATGGVAVTGDTGYSLSRADGNQGRAAAVPFARPAALLVVREGGRREAFDYSADEVALAVGKARERVAEANERNLGADLKVVRARIQECERVSRVDTTLDEQHPKIHLASPDVEVRVDLLLDGGKRPGGLGFEIVADGDVRYVAQQTMAGGKHSHQTTAGPDNCAAANEVAVSVDERDDGSVPAVSCARTNGTPMRLNRLRRTAPDQYERTNQQ
jgi:hypothetical protein